MAMCLKNKSGVECIDVNDFLMEMFVSVGYDALLEESETEDMPKINFRRVSRELTDIQDLVEALKSKVADAEYPGDENLEDNPAKPEEAPNPPEEPEEEASSEEESSEEEEKEASAPETVDKDEVVDDMAELEDMVADIAAELGMGSEEEKETE